MPRNVIGFKGLQHSFTQSSCLAIHPSANCCSCRITKAGGNKWPVSLLAEAVSKQLGLCGPSQAMHQTKGLLDSQQQQRCLTGLTLMIMRQLDTHIPKATATCWNVSLAAHKVLSTLLILIQKQTVRQHEASQWALAHDSCSTATLQHKRQNKMMATMRRGALHQFLGLT